MNPRPLGYEPNELPDCSTSRYKMLAENETIIQMLMQKFIIIKRILIFCCLSLFSYQTFSQTNTAQLLSLMESTKAGTTIDLAIQVQLKKGWHTYWENPGDIGQPMEIQWNLPPSLKITELNWPRPQRIRSGKWNSFGYKKDFLLLTKLKIPSSYKEKSIPIQAQVQWLVCKKVCVPLQKTLKRSIPISKKAKNQSTNQKVIHKR